MSREDHDLLESLIGSCSIDAKNAQRCKNDSKCFDALCDTTA